MDDLRDWQKQIRKFRHRKWNKPDVPQFHKAEYEYAKRKGVTCVYVDIETGEIMQFGASKSLELHKKQWEGMFPDRKMQAIYTKDYESFIEELKNKKSKQ
jgi:hypothetical protein